ncbi:MAG: archease [Microgenomates group bacterium]|nr:archease [Microgenomates group bacterium]
MKKWFLDENKSIADIMVVVYGQDKEKLLKNSLLAFTSIITDIKKLKSKYKIKIKIKESSFPKLLFNFVEQLIYLKDSQNILFKEAKLRLLKNHLIGQLIGDKISLTLPIKTDIKALTYHSFLVKKAKNYYRAKLVFDV